MNVILHICCGVCAAGAADVLLKEGHRVTGYFYNPNIYPEEEYVLRLEAARRTAEHLGFDLVEGIYEPGNWISAVAAFQDEPEGGQRCLICYRVRMANSYNYMVAAGADAFSSTLTISPHKSAIAINRIGTEIGGNSFMARDFKKKDGFKKAAEMAKSWGIYRQYYCGCVYSLQVGGVDGR
jgi:predicted adenine nucleotide alpha hydrolase (AANH) superfamily ATPase